MKFIVLIVTLITLISIPATAYDWVTNPTNGHQYTIVDNNSSWQDAENKAIALGGHLVTIRSQAENDWVFDYAVTKTNTTASVVYGAWIGLYQIPGSAEPLDGWIWSSREPIVYTNWQTSTGEPNNYYGSSAPEDWAKMYIRQHDWDENPSFWNDTWNYEPARPDTIGIVEVNPVPEPSSLIALLGGVVGLFTLRYHRRRR